MNKIKLNLGCGNKILEGYKNFDKFPINTKVKYIDLNKLPLPFDDNYADEILLDHVLEHVDNDYELIEDLYRILKPNGLLRVNVPVHCNVIQHKRGMHGKSYLNCFTNNITGQHQELFDLVSAHGGWTLGFLQWLGDLKSRFQDLLFTEYRFVLRKKN